MNSLQSLLEHAPIERKLAYLFRSMDLDHSGLVEEQECVDALQALMVVSEAIVGHQTDFHVGEVVEHIFRDAKELALDDFKAVVLKDEALKQVLVQVLNCSTE